MAISFKSTSSKDSTSDNNVFTAVAIFQAAAGPDRALMCSITSEDSADADMYILSVVVDPSGVNKSLTLGKEVSNGGGSWSNYSSIWYLKEVDFPAAGTYDIVITFTGTVTEYAITANVYENVDPSVIDAVGTGTALKSVTQVSDPITTITDGAWIFDSCSGGNGVVLISPDPPQVLRNVTDAGSHYQGCSDLLIVTAGATSSNWTAAASENRLVLASVAMKPKASGAGGLDSNINLVLEDSTSVLNSDTEQRVNSNIALDDSSSAMLSNVEQSISLLLALEDSSSNMQSSVEGEITVSVQLDDSISNISASKEEAVTVNLVLENSISNLQVTQENEANLSLILSDSITSILVKEIENAYLDLMLDSSLTSGTIALEQRANLNKILEDSITSIQSSSGNVELNSNIDITLGNALTSIVTDLEISLSLNNTVQDTNVEIVASEVETVFLQLQLEATTTNIQAEQVNSINANVPLQDSVTSISASLDSSGAASIGLQLQDVISSLLLTTENRINLSVQLEGTNIVVSVSGIILTDGSFTKIVNQNNIFTKIVEGSNIFTKGVDA